MTKLLLLIKYPYFYLILISIPFFLAFTNAYIPFGRHGGLKLVFDLQSIYWKQMESLFIFYPENILYAGLFFLSVFMATSKKYWEWIGFTYLGIIVLLLATYGF